MKKNHHYHPLLGRLIGRCTCSLSSHGCCLFSLNSSEVVKALLTSMSLLVAGATGAIGRCVVRNALQRKEFTRVVALTRRGTEEDPKAHFGLSLAESDSSVVSAEPKEGSSVVTAEQLSRLQPVTFDWEAFCGFWERRHCSRAVTHPEKNNVEAADEDSGEFYRKLFTGHTYVAMCLGTTRRDAGSAANFMRCDYDYVVAFAQAVQVFSGNDLRCFAQVSAQMANKNSWFLYPQTKGRADFAVEELKMPRLCIYRPGLLDRGEKTRTVEKIAKWFVSAIPVETCGRAIVRDFLHCSGGHDAVHSEECRHLPCAGRKGSAPSHSGEIYYFDNSDIVKESSALLEDISPQ
uniref:NAD(P)-binding domain-containing protein n=1 Tax=Trypanosoma congolense (strain IL3000) TaxID=1068625 RepID=G0UR06_TRYCI|nr:conserved hypothetical protein [Trypanosoma congolense IL3000]